MNRRGAPGRVLDDDDERTNEPYQQQVTEASLSKPSDSPIHQAVAYLDSEAATLRARLDEIDAARAALTPLAGGTPPQPKPSRRARRAKGRAGGEGKQATCNRASEDCAGKVHVVRCAAPACDRVSVRCDAHGGRVGAGASMGGHAKHKHPASAEDAG